MSSSNSNMKYKVRYEPILPLISVGITITYLLTIAYNVITTRVEVTTSTRHNPKAPVRAIYVLETSGARSSLNVRQACSVESTARTNQDLRINVMFTSPTINSNSPPMRCLQAYPNIVFHHLDARDLFLSSPLRNWYLKDPLQTVVDTDYRTALISDALRLVLLHKHGGIYLDLDNLVLRSLSDFRNTLGSIFIWKWLYIRTKINNSVLIFEPGHWFVDRCLADWEGHFNSSGAWGHHGPGLVTRVLQNNCPEYTEMFPKLPLTCRGLTVLESQFFNPTNIYELDKPNIHKRNGSSVVRNLFPNSYMIHMTRHRSDHMDIITKGSGQYMDVLFERYCPCVYESIGPNKTRY